MRIVKGKLEYTYLNFPYDKLRVGSLKNKTASSSSFGSTHQYTYIEYEPGLLKNYTVAFPELVADSFSYYIDENETNMMNPKFYINPKLHHAWSKLDKNGQVSKATSQEGLDLEAFFENFEKALLREIRLLPDTERVPLMGAKFANITDSTTLLEIQPVHPTYGKDHPKSGFPNETQSKTFNAGLWSDDIVKKAQRAANSETSNRRKFANLPSSLNNTSKTPQPQSNGGDGVVSQHVGKKLKVPDNSILHKYNNNNNIVNEEKKNEEEEDVLKVPDTNCIIYTPIYDLTPEAVNDINVKKTNKRKASALEEEEPVPKISDYRQFRRFVYSSKSHPNGSTRGELMIVPTFLGPSILWEPKKSNAGTIRWNMSECTILHFQTKKFNRGMDIDKQKQFLKSREDLAKKYGFEKDNNEDDDDDEDDDRGGLIEHSNNGQGQGFLSELNINNNQQYYENGNDFVNDEGEGEGEGEWIEDPNYRSY
jgi:hypothetical protein